MKKWKFFASLLKERDWLEEMARQGWLLKDMTLGMLYHFDKIEPAEKVYEIERFTMQGKPTKEKLTARKTALDIVEQAGWDVVTHDETMNYYFVKDKAGDESDEFYDDAGLRRERAEKFRKEYCYDMIIVQLGSMLFLAVAFIFNYIIESLHGDSFAWLSWMYIIFTIVDISYCIWMMCLAQQWYDELCLSREEWEHRKRFGEKKKFKKISNLLEYLADKAAQGQMLTDYDKGTYLFAETDVTYQYEIDTKRALKKRMEAQGEKYHNEEKDWTMIGLKWYEMSIAEAQKNGLEFVTVIDSNTLVYRRVCQGEEKSICLNPGYDESLGWKQKLLQMIGLFLLLMVIAYIVGYVIGSVLAAVVL